MSSEDDIRAYLPANSQEEADKALMLGLLESGQDLLTRRNGLCHFTASAWVTTPVRDRVLMCFHNIYGSWSWLGGHADGERDLSRVALREVREESGLSRVRLVSDGPISLEVLTVDGHVRHGAYVSSHLHLNLTYLVEADPTEPLLHNPDENAGVAWFSPKEAVRRSTEPWFRERIYPKLNVRLRTM